MSPPFTVEGFYGVFRDDNAAVWPAHWILVARALAAMVAVLRPRPRSGVAESAILGPLRFAVPRTPRGTLIVPVLWCGIGAQAAFDLGVVRDLALIATGVVGVMLLLPLRGPLRTRTS